MDIAKIPAGRSPPYDVNVVVEIPQGSALVKYEFDKESGTVFVDRFLHTAMFYPGNYGFVPHTLAQDGDPVDVLILGSIAVVPGAVVRCRPVGVLRMEDESGGDEKILAAPIGAVDAFFADVRSHEELPATLKGPDRSFLQSLQRSRTREMGETARLGRCSRGRRAHRGVDRAREGSDAGRAIA
jgi:inorganic pyrophosphatase